MARVQAEVYRPLRVPLRARRLRWWPMVAASIGTAARRKLPLALLYGVPAIGTVIFSFVVYLRYAFEQRVVPEALGGGGALIGAIAAQALRNLEVANQIAQFDFQTSWFALLAAAWFGSGLLAEDRRLGAHQLYFARPLTRLDYFLGKLLVVAFFASLATLVPGLVIVVVASFASPDWSFLKDEWDVIPRIFAHALVWVAVTSSVSLCASSLAPRKTLALVGIFAFFALSSAVGGALGELLGPGYYVLSPVIDLWSVTSRIFEVQSHGPQVETARAWTALAALVAAALGVVAWRLRRLEVVA